MSLSTDKSAAQLHVSTKECTNEKKLVQFRKTTANSDILTFYCITNSRLDPN